jgi:YVTN family beta-propeller protein
MRVSSVSSAVVALAALYAACSSPDTKIEYEPYAGPPAYPDKRPKLPAPKGGYAFVSDSLSDTVTVLDVPANEVIAQIPVGRDPVGIDGPHHLAVDKDGTVYVALSYPQPTTLPGPHAAHASASRPGFVHKLGPTDLHVIGEVQIDANPGEIVLAPDGSKIIVTHFDLARAIDAKLTPEDQKATLMVIDPKTMVMGGSPAPIAIKVCRAPHGASIAADGKTAFVACYADDAVAIVDLANPSTPPTLVPVGSKGPYSAVLSPSGKLCAIGNTDGKDTRVLDTQTRTMKAEAIPTLGAPYFAAWANDETKMWIPAQGPDELVVVDPATNAVLTRRTFDAATCQRPHEAQLSKDGATLYLVCEGDHVNKSVVLALDPTTLETKSTMTVGVYPDRFAFAGAK